MKNTFISIHGHLSLLKPIPIDFSRPRTPIHMFICSKTKTQIFAIFAFLMDRKWHFLLTVGHVIQHAELSAIRVSRAEFLSRFEFLSRNK